MIFRIERSCIISQWPYLIFFVNANGKYWLDDGSIWFWLRISAKIIFFILERIFSSTTIFFSGIWKAHSPFMLGSWWISAKRMKKKRNRLMHSMRTIVWTLSQGISYYNIHQNLPFYLSCNLIRCILVFSNLGYFMIRWYYMVSRFFGDNFHSWKGFHFRCLRCCCYGEECRKLMVKFN